jgi:hypothetical protein
MLINKWKGRRVRKEIGINEIKKKGESNIIEED